MIEYIWRVNDFDVYYTNETNGGGDYFALEYMQIVNDWYQNVDSILEWCAGPGFIGFGMLASNLCNTVSFNEMYQPAIDVLEKTKNKSNLKQYINIYKGRSLDSIPSDKKFDLIIGNPPHWKNVEEAINSLNINTNHTHIEDILVDKDWDSHKLFYSNAKKFLSLDGKILLQENSQGSVATDFKEMIDSAGLRILSTAESKMYKDVYYIEVGHK